MLCLYCVGDFLFCVVIGDFFILFVIGDFVWSGLRIWVGDFFVFLFLVVDVFIIILMSYLYYFNQIAKNIDPLMLGAKR